MLSSIQILVKQAIAMLKKANKIDRATDNPKGSIQHNKADKNQQNQSKNIQQIQERLNEESSRTAMAIFGFILAIPLFIMALFLSVKIYHTFVTEHKSIMIFIGIAFNLLLYYLAYQSTKLGQGKFMEDTSGETVWQVTDKKLLPTWVSLPLRLIATLMFVWMLVIGIQQRHFMLIISALLLLLWTHYSQLKNFKWLQLNEDRLHKTNLLFMKILRIGVLIGLFASIVRYIAAML